LTGRSFDVVHSAHPLMMPARDSASVVTIHDLDFLTHPERTRAEIRRDYPLLARSHAERADRILVPSRYTAAEVERQLGIDVTRVSICPLGGPGWPARSGFPENGYILFVGTLERRKNVGALLDAYARLLARHDAMPPLVLAGATTDAAAPWLARLAEAPLAGHARHVGYIQPEEREALYAGAALLVMPSLDEGFGLPVLEAMTIGVPVIAADRGALSEVLGDAGLAVEPDEESLAAAMERMIFDTSVAQAFSAKGVLRSHRFTWRATADAVLDGYREAIASHARGARRGRR
jgi:glycosyltransferase involved in cell wall biosynthesis